MFRSVAPKAGRKSAAGRLLRRQRGEGEGVDRTRHFLGQKRVDAALTGDPTVAGEGRRDDLDVEMRLALRARAGMAGMALGIVADHKTRRLQRRGELGPDAIGNT